MIGTHGDSTGGRRSRPGGYALVASLVAHVLAIGVLWSAGLRPRPPLPPFKVYEVNIVSPPPKEAGTPAPVAVNAPKVSRPEPKPEPRPVESKPRPQPQTERQPPPKTEAKPETKPDPAKTAAVEEEPKTEPPESRPAGAKPDPNARTAGEGIDVRIEGEEFPFPGYLENIQVQIGRYFRWTGQSGLEAEIYFVIRKDGTIEDIRLVSGSGNASFNFEAMGAIEQAGLRAAFGPLPDDFASDRLPVLFYFRPAR